jgi:hypothetical protein
MSVGDTLGASVWATNTGDIAENFSFTLKMDDAFMRDKTVRLDGGETRQVTFSFVVANAGEHTVHILGAWSGGNVTLSDKIAVAGAGLPLEWVGAGFAVPVFTIVVVWRLRKHSKKNKLEKV